MKYQLAQHGWPIGQWLIPVGTIIDLNQTPGPNDGLGETGTRQVAAAQRRGAGRRLRGRNGESLPGPSLSAPQGRGERVMARYRALADISLGTNWRLRTTCA